MWLIHVDEYIGLSYYIASVHPKAMFTLSHLGLRFTTTDCEFEWCNSLRCIAHPTGLSFVSK